MALGVYRKVFNSQTGETDLQTSCILLSHAAEPMQNVNGTLFYPATVKIVDANGEEQIVSAIIYAKNFDYGVEVGKEYVLTVSKGDERGPILHMSHLSPLPMAKRATKDMFDFEEVGEFVEFG